MTSAPVRRDRTRHSGLPAWLIAGGLPALLMATVGAWGLGHGAGYDEVISLSAAQRPWGDLWALVQKVDVVHAVYYACLHLWLLPGGGEVWSRVPSLAAAVATAGLLGVIGARSVGLRAGVLAGLVFPLLPSVTFYAQEARAYTMVCACVVMASYCLLRAVDRAGAPRGWWVAYAAVMSTGLLLNEMAALALVAHAVTLLAARVGRAVWAGWLAAAVVSGVVALPVVVVSLRQSGQLSYVSAPTWAVVGRLLESYLGYAVPAAVLVVLLVLAGLTRGRGEGGGVVSLRALAAPLLILPATLLLLVSFVHPLFRERYVFYSTAAVALLAGAGADRVLGWVLGWVPWPTGPAATAALTAGAVSLVALAQLSGLREIRSPQAGFADLAGAARVIRNQARPGDGVLFTRGGFRAAAVAYPGSFRATTDIALGQTAVQAANLTGTDKPPAAVQAALLRFRRVWVVGLLGRDARLGKHPTAAAARVVLRRDYRITRAVDLHRVQVILFTRRS